MGGRAIQSQDLFPPPPVFVSIHTMLSPIDRFKVEQHDGPYNTWPKHSRLYDGNTDTGQKLEGYNVIRQFAVGDHFLLILDFDCLFEEANVLYLIGSDYRIVARTLIPELDGNPFPASYLLQRAEVQGPFELVLHYGRLPSRLVKIDLQAKGLSPRYLSVETLHA